MIVVFFLENLYKLLLILFPFFSQIFVIEAYTNCLSIYFINFYLFQRPFKGA